jgi:hypothetical protein
MLSIVLYGFCTDIISKCHGSEYRDAPVFLAMTKKKSLSRSPLDQNAQIILVGAREGRDAIKNEIGIEIEESLQLQTYSINSE